jgi:hypothetical protein
MSRVYRVRVSETVERVIHVEDGVCTSLELLPILARERMQELLAHQLRERGFKVEGDTATRKEDDGVLIEVDLGSGQVKVQVEQSADIKRDAERTVLVEEESAERRRVRLQKELRESLEDEVEQEQEKLRQAATETLEAKLRELKGEFDRVLNRTTAEALKQRAGEIGEIEELSENQESGELTIKVKL